MRPFVIAAASAAALCLAGGSALAGPCTGTFSETGAAQTCTVSASGQLPDQILRRAWRRQ